MNQLILGDNLEILRNWDSESVDLIYLDPPFFSNRTYEVIWGDRGEVRSFEDRWAGGVDHYIAWLKERVVEMHRILKPTGSIFLHCDWHANAYIRVYILDKLFGGNNFRGEIVWKRTSAHNSSKGFGPIHDTIYHYSKSKDFTWNQVFEKYNEEYVQEFYRLEDDNGRYQLVDLTADGIRNGDSGKPWKGIDPTKVKRHWAIPQKQLKMLFPKLDTSSMKTQELLDFLEENGYIVWPEKKGGKPRFKRYLHTNGGPPVQDLILDIKPVSSQAAERIGYPTQKPIMLLERIILAASNEGDVVMDPFLGGGTTVVAADRLNRRWVGIDQSVMAIKVSEMRVFSQQNDPTAKGSGTMYKESFAVTLHKYDYDTLRYKDAFEFETWIVQQYGGIANAKRGGDMGMDGRTRDGRPIQVKRSDNIGRNVVDNFFSAVQRHDKRLYELNKAEGKPVGVIIAFSFGKGAVQEVARLKNEEGVLVELVTVESIVPIAKKPTIVLTFEDLGSDAKGNRTLRLRAEGSSEAGIEFYAWQWNHEPSMGFRPDVLIDREGTVTNAFAPGAYNLAVRAVDNEGLDATETLRLYINGGVKVRG